MPPAPDRFADAVAARLAAAGCVFARDEAAVLVAEAAKAADGALLDDWVSRREQGEPLAWIVGHTTFCGRRLSVAPGVYVPRTQSENLTRRAVERLAGRAVAVDLCTGSGAVAAHLVAQVPTATVIGVDIDETAARCARSNGVDVVVADVDPPLRDGCADVVTAVAPYVPTGAVSLLPLDVRRFEPRRALDGGSDGLDVVRRCVAAAVRLLRPGGWLLLECGGDQDTVLMPALVAVGFERVTPWHDDEGDLRGLEARAARRDRPVWHQETL